MDLSRFSSINKFSKRPRHIRYVLSVAVAENVERLAPFTMNVFVFFCLTVDLTLRCITVFIPHVKKKKRRCRSGTTKGNLLPKTEKLGSNPLHTEPVLQLNKKVKKDTEASWNHYLQISPNTSVFSHGHEDPWKTTWRSCERLGLDFFFFAECL